MIFVTVGSQKFQFDRLLEEIDRLIDVNVIEEKVFAQTGCSNYVPKNYSYKQFVDRDEFGEYVDEADIVITHGGTGVIVSSIKKGKKVIAVPRLSKYKEHVDNHQRQIIEQFKEQNLIMGLGDCEELENAIKEIKNKEFNKYASNTEKYIRNISEYIDGL